MKILRPLSHFLLLLIALQANSQVIFVDQGASGGNNGSSWASAFEDLQDETDVATICGSCMADIEEILEDEIAKREV